ncbi:DNA helicase, partial [Tanacetum coccineum]
MKTKNKAVKRKLPYNLSVECGGKDVSKKHCPLSSHIRLDINTSNVHDDSLEVSHMGNDFGCHTDQLLHASTHADEYDNSHKTRNNIQMATPMGRVESSKRKTSDFEADHQLQKIISDKAKKMCSWTTKLQEQKRLCQRENVSDTETFKKQNRPILQPKDATRCNARISQLNKVHQDSVNQQHLNEESVSTANKIPLEYNYLGKCTSVCRYCGAKFWECENVASTSNSNNFVYNKCCNGGRTVLRPTPVYPQYIKELYKDKHFMENIRAYNQMFSMTSLGANVDSSINNGKGPYVFRVSGLIYHWIGSMCPDEGQPPRFLQLYIYDTANEVKNRMANFGNQCESALKKEIVEGLIELLDSHNALVQLFRTARNKYMEAKIPEFKVRLYNVIGTRQYELPTAETIGAIVFAETSGTENDFDLIVEEHSRFPQRVNKLHPCYMALQFPLLFIYGEDGYHTDMKLANVSSQTTKANKRLSMNMYYSYQIHDRLNDYSLILRGGRLCQQYVVTAYCAIEQSRLDFIRQKQNDIRNEYLSGIYDAILRGDCDANNLGMHTVLTASFTGGPRYMYAHYLDALAICRVHGSPSFFITFTCNAKWPEIEEYMEPFPQLTTADRADIVDRVFEKK